MKRPNPILHMLFWGFGSGIILALLYVIFIFSLNTIGLGETLLALISPELWWIAFLFGGLPGAGLGFLMGVILWTISRNFPTPFTHADMQAWRFAVYLALGIGTGIGGLFLTLSFFGADIVYLWLFLIFPPFIAAIAAAYAGHRYLFRLRLWSDSQFGAQKEKAKNIAQLEDKLKREDEADDSTAEEQQYKSS